MKLEKLKKLAKRAASRPILQGLCYRDDEIIFTDSYVLIIKKNTEKVDKSFVVSLIDGHLLKGNYPDVSKIKPKEDELEKVSDIVLEIKPYKDPVYVANGGYFRKKEVEEAFACLGLKPFDQEVMNNLYVRKNKLMMIYDDQDKGQYALILGFRID